KERGEPKGDKDGQAAGKDGQGGAKNDSGRSGSGGRDKGSGGKDARGRPGEPPAPDPAKALPEWSTQLAQILKWVWGRLAILLVVFLLMRSGLKFLANFTLWARRLLDALRAWWQGLWGGGKEARAEEEVVEMVELKPFASFRDPFLFG